MERQEPGGNFSENWYTAGNQFCNLRCPANASSGGHRLEFASNLLVPVGVPAKSPA